MPFRSKKQWRAAFRGRIKGISKAKAREWAHETGSYQDLPEKVKKSSLEEALLPLCTKIAINISMASGGSMLRRAGQGTGKFTGTATSNFLKPPGGSMAKTVVNPRRNIGQAMRTG